MRTGRTIQGRPSPTVWLSDGWTLQGRVQADRTMISRAKRGRPFGHHPPKQQRLSVVLLQLEALCRRMLNQVGSATHAEDRGGLQQVAAKSAPVCLATQDGAG